MTLFIVILLLLVGIFGSFMNRFPAPLFLLAAAIIAVSATHLPIVWWHLPLIILLTAVCLLLDYLVPRWMKGKSDYSDWSKRGAVIGSILTIILVTILLVTEGQIGTKIPWFIACFFLLPFLFALFFEYLARKRFIEGLKAAGNVAIAFYTTTVLKLLTAVLILYLLLPL